MKLAWDLCWHRARKCGRTRFHRDAFDGVRQDLGHGPAALGLCRSGQAPAGRAFGDRAGRAWKPACVLEPVIAVTIGSFCASSSSSHSTVTGNSGGVALGVLDQDITGGRPGYAWATAQLSYNESLYEAAELRSCWPGAFEFPEPGIPISAAPVVKRALWLCLCRRRSSARRPDMKYRKLGDSDLEVSEISLGSWLTYGVGVEADKARACLEEAFEQGINFIDTANVYGRGAAESFLGEALQGRRARQLRPRDQALFPDERQRPRPVRAQIEKQLDASLKRLRTDYVDLYQCHRYDDDTPLEETMEALTRAVESGKTRYIGFSEWPADRIQAAIDLDDRRSPSSSPASRNIRCSGASPRTR